MSRPTILTVDDDPQVSAALTRDLKRQYGSRVPRAVGDVGRPGARAAARPGAAHRPGRADRERPADAGEDRHRAAGRVARPRARGQAAPAHGVRRHRRRDHGDQRDRPRLLPAQAVGPARGAALPGHRRPARRLATGPSRGHQRHPGRRRPVVRPHPRAQDVPGPQPRPVPLVRRGARRRGRSGSSSSPGQPRRPAARAGARAASTLRSPTLLELAERARAAHRRPSSRSTTSASSAADRPGSRQRCTPPPRACRRSSSSARRPAVRPARARRSRTTSASPRG